MKKLILAVAICLSGAFILKAQTESEELQYFQALFGMEKKLAVAEFLQISGDASVSFWEVYDAYDYERRDLGLKRIELLNKYADQYLDLDDEKTEAIIKEIIALSKAYDNLITKYYKKIKKSNGVKTAAQFYQIELYVKSSIRVAILSSVPFVGEFE
jgi:hypothetical protein